jgi:hypothetical protein
MYRIDNSSAITTLPTPAAVGPNPNGFFTNGNPAVPQQATVVDQDWLNAVQEELCGAVTGLGGTLSKTNHNQLATLLLSAFVKLSHNSIFGTVLNSGGPNISATVSFTPAFNGILVMNGAAAQNGGEFTAVSQTLVGVGEKEAYGNNSAGATSNLSSFGSTGTVTAGTPVTLTASMTGTGANNSFTNIGFSYHVLPTS